MDRRSLILSLPALLCFTASSRAQAVKPYQLELIPGTLHNGTYQAGLKLILTDQWKTYWRMPGEAGISPSFEWSKSENLASVEVLYPKPNRYSGADGDTIGYKNEVLFPLLVHPKESGAPVRLNLDMSFAVCEKICLPADGQAETTLPGTATGDAAIAPWVALVPKQLEQGQSGPIAAAHVASRNSQLFLVLSLNDRPSDIFVESDSAAYFRAPQFDPTKPEAWLPIDNISDPAKLSNQRLVLTSVMPDQAFQQTLQLPQN